MPNSWLLEKNFNDGLQETHYFDGRLLSADAFKADQDAVQKRLDLLGRATGYGIIEGLMVRKVQTSVTQLSISKGMGLNYAGHIIRLPGDMTLNLAKSASAPSTPALQAQLKAGTFTGVSILRQHQATSNGGAASVSISGIIPEGVYLLTVLPVSQFEGLALMRSSVGGVSSGVSNAPGCGSKWEVEGVQFKVIRLDTSDLSGLFANVPDIQLYNKEDLRRNLLAHWCYGTLIVRDFGIHPFDFTDKYSPLDPNAGYIADLSMDDLPLAAFHWDGNQVSFVDMWAARRRVVHPDAVTGTNSSLQLGSWKAIMDDRRVAENQARFRQFQDQLDGIVASGNMPGSGTDLTKVKVTDSFTFLPPVGFLPVTQNSLQAILCHIEEKKRIIGWEKEEEQWDTSVHLVASAPNLRTSGAFEGGVPEISLVRVTQKAQERQATAEQQPSQTPLEFSEDIEISGHKEKERVVYEMPHIRFYQRVCATISQPRVKVDGSARSKTEGFDLVTFFDGYLLRFSLIGKDRVDELMNTSWYGDAIDLRPNRHADPRVDHPGQEPEEYPIEKGLHPMPLLFDIYLVEENLRDTTQPLYIIFRKALHPVETIRYYRHGYKEAAPVEQAPAVSSAAAVEQAPAEGTAPVEQAPAEGTAPVEQAPAEKKPSVEHGPTHRSKNRSE